MKITISLVGKIAGAIAALIIAYALGYSGGSSKTRNWEEKQSSLTPSDMGHAFGAVKSSGNDPLQDDEPKAMSLSGLVAGLEKKVAANPENIDQQLLLAQTYNELDNREKSLKLLRALVKQAPKNAQVKITLATILMKSSSIKELNEALKLFEEAIKIKPESSGMARLYQGEIRVKLDEMAKR